MSRLMLGTICGLVYGALSAASMRVGNSLRASSDPLCMILLIVQYCTVRTVACQAEPRRGETVYLVRLSSLSGGRTTRRPSTGKALSSIENPIPSL